MGFRKFFTFIVVGTLGTAGFWSDPADAVYNVTATVETTPVPNSGDAADDTALWVHPSDVSQSTVIGTNKQGGIAVYNLAGQQLQYRADGKINNVDLRYNFLLGSQRVAIVAGSNRTSNSISLYRVNPSTKLLEPVHARTITVGLSEIYGLAMYRSQVSGKYYVIVCDRNSGATEQWEIFDNGAGKVDAKRVRTLNVGTQSEGIVADDELGHLYIAEEDVGIWKYGAEPTSGTTRVSVDKVGSGRLTADVEGLAIYKAKDNTGYLIASSQGNNTYAIYERQDNNTYIDSFAIASGSIDGVNDTDGIEVQSFGLGSLFPEGVFIAQDGVNTGGNQNYKLVPWGQIARGSRIPLLIDKTTDPRLLPGGVTSPSSPSPVVSSSPSPSPYPSPYLEPDLPSSSSTALNMQIASQTGEFVAEMVLQPSANNIDASTILAGKKVVKYTDGAMIVRFNPSGMIDVRNGGAYGAMSLVPYSAGNRYHVKITGNVLTRKYSVNVTPAGSSISYQIAKDYSFRTEQASVTLINHLAVKSSVGSHSVYSFKVAAASTASPSPTVSSAPLPSPTASVPVVGASPVMDFSSSSSAVQNRSITSQSGGFTAEMDLVPLATGIDAVTMLAGKTVSAWSDAAILVRFNPSGMMDARNGGVYAASASLSYVANKRYHVRIDGNVSTRRYSVTVTPEGDSAVQIAKDYAFRTEQASVSVINTLAVKTSTGSHQVQNFRITATSAASPVPSPSPSKSVTPSPSPIVSSSPVPQPSSPTSLNWSPVPCGSSNNTVSYMGRKWANNSDCRPYSIGMSPSGKVLRFEIRQGDNRWNGADDGSAVDRDELRLEEYWKAGTEIWGAYSLMIEPGATTDSRWTILGQMHGGSGGLSPPLNFDLSPTNPANLRVMTLHDGASGMQQRAAPGLERGKWYNIVFRVKFQGSGYTSPGLLEVWINGAKVYSNLSMSIGFTSAAENYWKIGVYRRTSAVTLAVRYANMEVVTGSGALLHRVSSPQPIQY